MTTTKEQGFCPACCEPCNRNRCACTYENEEGNMLSLDEILAAPGGKATWKDVDLPSFARAVAKHVTRKKGP